MGWILLHIVIGFIGLTFVQGLALGGLLAATGRVTEEPPARTTAAFTLAAVIGLVAWLMFVYLNRSRRVRWTVFLAMLLGGFTLALVVSFVSLPAV